jgi:negative regulator of sigma E activity
MFKSFIWIISLVTATAAFAQEPSPAEILRKADEARGNIAGQAVEWTVTLTTTREDETKEMQLHIVARASDMLTEILAPDKVKGQKLLVSGGEMWFYKPGLSRPIAVPRRQKLLGDASTGDITSTDYAGEYDATPLPDEKIDGMPCYVFDLKAKTHAVTYEQVKYWVSKTRLVGVKAEFYSVSGKKLKTVTIEHHDNFEIAGKKRAFISRMTIIDELAKDKVTTLDFSTPATVVIPADFFNPDHLSNPKAAQ